MKKIGPRAKCEPAVRLIAAVALAFGAFAAFTAPVAAQNSDLKAALGSGREAAVELSPAGRLGAGALTEGGECTPEWVPTFGRQPGVDRDVRTLTVFDDGSGPALYAGGNFTTAGGVAASRIVKWDGASWSPLGSGMSSTVNALTVFDDGAGPALIVGGEFITSPGDDSFIAKWQGCALSSFSADVNRDGLINAIDLLIILNYFGTSDTAADINNDGVVDGADLLILLNNFTG